MRAFQNNKHLYGIDLLRIISMLMIVIYHICGNGGVINAVSDNVWKYASAEFWRIATSAWLAYMYFIGGSIRKYYHTLTCKKKLIYGLTGICFLFTLTWSVLIGFLFQSGENYFANVFSAYTSPTVLLISVCFLVAFADMQFNKAITKIIKFLSPACFGVYLIHVNGLIWHNFWMDRFAWMANYNAVLIFFLVPLCAVVIYIACILLEKLRILLFKLLRINKLCDIIYNAIYKIEIKYFNKLQRKMTKN